MRIKNGNAKPGHDAHYLLITPFSNLEHLHVSKIGKPTLKIGQIAVCIRKISFGNFIISTSNASAFRQVQYFER